MPFTLLEYVVRIAYNIRSKFSEFSIDYNTNLPKMAQECTQKVTSRQMNSLPLYVKRAINLGSWCHTHDYNYFTNVHITVSQSL